MKSTTRLLGLAVTCLAVSGCNRQDADALSRIGQLLVAKARTLPAAEATGKVVTDIPASLKPNNMGGNRHSSN